MTRTILVLSVLLGLSGCSLIKRKVDYKYDEAGRVLSVSGNMSPVDLTRTTESLASQQAAAMAIEHGVPVTTRDPYNAIPTTQVGGSQPYMYGHGGYGYGGYSVGMSAAMQSEYYTVQRQLIVNPNAPPVGAPGYQTLPSLGRLQQQVHTQGVVISEMVDVVE
jgi:hypothetical protein